MRVWKRGISCVSGTRAGFANGLKLIADLGNQNKTCDKQAALIILVAECDREYIHTL